MNKKAFNLLFTGASNSSIVPASSGGAINLWNTDFATVHNAIGGGYFWGYDFTIICSGINSPNYGIARSFGLFDLSAVTGVITGAKVILDNWHASNSTNYVAIQSCPNIGNLTLNDYSNFSIPLLGYGNEKIDITTQTVDFNAAGIAKLNEKGIQRFMFRNGESDYSNVVPTGQAGMGLYGGYVAPKLILTFS